MARVICTLPNASETINGVAFVTHAKGMISADLSDEAAAAFCEVPGYIMAPAVKAKDAEKTVAPPSGDQPPA